MQNSAICPSAFRPEDAVLTAARAHELTEADRADLAAEFRKR